jgi:hypothetical protein
MPSLQRWAHRVGPYTCNQQGGVYNRCVVHALCLLCSWAAVLLCCCAAVLPCCYVHVLLCCCAAVASSRVSSCSEGDAADDNVTHRRPLSAGHVQQHTSLQCVCCILLCSAVFCCVLLCSVCSTQRSKGTAEYQHIQHSWIFISTLAYVTCGTTKEASTGGAPVPL